MTEQTPATAGIPTVRRRGKQTKFIIGGAVIVAAVAFLIYSSMGGSTLFYMTVDELKSQGAEGVGKKVRVAGLVVGDTIQWDEKKLDLRFEIQDAGGRLAVAYHGLRPDMLQDAAEAVVEGKLNSQGIFEASNLMLKCPSKYEEAATKQASSSNK